MPGCTTEWKPLGVVDRHTVLAMRACPPMLCATQQGLKLSVVPKTFVESNVVHVVHIAVFLSTLHVTKCSHTSP